MSLEEIDLDEDASALDEFLGDETTEEIEEKGNFEFHLLIYAGVSKNDITSSVECRQIN